MKDQLEGMMMRVRARLTAASAMHATKVDEGLVSQTVCERERREERGGGER